MKQHNSQKQLKEAAVSLYRDGNTVAEIISGDHRPPNFREQDTNWVNITRRSLSRWIKIAKMEDPDLQIWHLLNRRWRRPGTYTNWEPNGVVIFPLNITYVQIRRGEKGPQVEAGSGLRLRLKFPDSDAVGPYLAELKSFGYSYREIVVLWRSEETQYPDRDSSPRVQTLVRQIQTIREKPMSYSTIRRILQTYSFADKGQIVFEVRDLTTGDSDE